MSDCDKAATADDDDDDCESYEDDERPSFLPARQLMTFWQCSNSKCAESRVIQELPLLIVSRLAARAKTTKSLDGCDRCGYPMEMRPLVHVRPD